MNETFNGAALRAKDLRPGFSVVICTYNRASFLKATIDAVLAQTYPRDLYELIIIDNGSSDGTGALIRRYLTSASIPISYHVERRAGASFARNLGIARADHEYVAFLDDDTVAGRGWLAGFDAAIRGHEARAGGGPVRPVLEPGIEPPIWWREHSIQSIFGLDHAHLYPSEEVVAIRWPLWLGACNSFYFKRLLQEQGGFRPDCGPVGNRYRVAQDVELNVRLERAGVAIYYVRDSQVKHRITRDRLSRRYLLRRAYCAGVTDAHAWNIMGSDSKAASLRQLSAAGLKFLLSGEPKRTMAGCRFAYCFGSLRKRLTMKLQRRGQGLEK
jgi:glycosyltransferase involved in cell wall biosynthesis